VGAVSYSASINNPFQIGLSTQSLRAFYGVYLSAIVWLFGKFSADFCEAAISVFEAINEKDYIPGLYSAMDYVD
jgi:hypothetical protein